MRIAHVVENLNRGGLERVVIDLALAQKASGHDCTVVCLYEEGLLAGELRANGIPVDACRKGSGFDIGALRRMRALLRAHGVEILHSHNIIAHVYAALASRGLGAQRFLNTRHGRGVAPPGRGRLRLYGLSMRWTDRVVAVCEAARRNLAEHDRIPAAKLAVIPNGIHVERFAAASPAAHDAVASLLGVGAATKIVGCVGRLNWAKDLPTLIRAFAVLRRRGRDAVLVLIGDGSLREDLERVTADEGIADRVVFLGDRSDVCDLLAGFDVFAMSSVSEGYSIALLEASASALPIVATDVGGNAEIVSDRISGRIVQPGTPVSLADALDEMLADPARARAMGEAGMVRVRREGSVEAMVARYDELYSER
jgi:glycosyltransferase involved in cell wall biosynthesis